jgi:putative membrane protein
MKIQNAKLPNSWLACFAAATLCLSISAQEQVDRPAELKLRGEQDQKSEFIKKAAQGNLFEIHAGELAASKGVNSQVREFGQMLQQDHLESQQKLRDLAGAEDLMPTHLEEKKAEKVKELQERSGEEFDKEFIKMSLTGHSKKIAKLESSLNELEDETLRSFVNESLQVMQKHLTRSKEIAATLGLDEATVASLIQEGSEGVGAPAEEVEIGGEAQEIDPIEPEPADDGPEKD